MKKKIILHSIGNEGKFNYYIFDKKQEVFRELSRALSKIGIYLSLFDEYVDKKGKFVTKKIDVNKFKDIHCSERGSSGNRLDIFYGDTKMFVNLHCSEKLRLKFNEELFKISRMPSYRLPKKVKTTKDKNKVLSDFAYNKNFLKKSKKKK
jgi:hypothetical protein